MKPAVLLITLVAAEVIAFSAPVSGDADEDASPIYGVTIPSGYRDWKLMSVTHEEGDFNKSRAQLGNDTAIKAYREAFVAGSPVNMQVMVKDSQKYSAVTHRKPFSDPRNRRREGPHRHKYVALKKESLTATSIIGSTARP